MGLILMEEGIALTKGRTCLAINHEPSWRIHYWQSQLQQSSIVPNPICHRLYHRYCCSLFITLPFSPGLLISPKNRLWTRSSTDLVISSSSGWSGLFCKSIRRRMLEAIAKTRLLLHTRRWVIGSGGLNWIRCLLNNGCGKTRKYMD